MILHREKTMAAAHSLGTEHDGVQKKKKKDWSACDTHTDGVSPGMGLGCPHFFFFGISQLRSKGGSLLASSPLGAHTGHPTPHQRRRFATQSSLQIKKTRKLGPQSLLTSHTLGSRRLGRAEILPTHLCVCCGCIDKKKLSPRRLQAVGEDLLAARSLLSRESSGQARLVLTLVRSSQQNTTSVMQFFLRKEKEWRFLFRMMK